MLGEGWAVLWEFQGCWKGAAAVQGSPSASQCHPVPPHTSLAASGAALGLQVALG